VAVPCSPSNEPELRVVALADGPLAGVAVRGEVEAVDRAIRQTRGPFVLDLSAVGFMDSTGIQALLRARALLGAHERPLFVVCPPGPVRRVLGIAGIEDLFVVHDSLEDARIACRPRRTTPGRS
jgi:anti-sigma B factor antagonist